MRRSGYRNKNIGPWLAFTEDWFRRHQRVLLWLLNTPLVRLWFRWVLRILPCDCPPATPILEIAPNRFTVAGPKSAQRTTVFRTHPKYAKRIYFAFRPLWWLLHAWDWAVADRWAPELSFGFATLTSYPDPHPEVTSCDGWVGQLSGWNSWNAVPYLGLTGIRNVEASASVYDSAADIVVRAMSGSPYMYASYCRMFAVLTRGVVIFDTSAIAGGEPTAATLTVRQTGKQNQMPQSVPGLTVVASTSSSTYQLHGWDYSSVGSTAFASRSWDQVLSGFNDFVLNGSGIAHISPTGLTRFALLLSWDQAGIEPGSTGDNQVSEFILNAADTIGTSYDPKLVVTYEPPIVPKSASDTGSIVAVESRSIVGTAQRTDAGTVSATESRSLLVSSNRADSGTISAVESSQRQIVLQVFERSDAGAITAVEESGLYTEGVIQADLSDSGTISAVESSSVDRIEGFAFLSAEDSGALTAAEEASLGYFKGASDAGAISAVESSELVKIYLPPPSAARLRVAPWLKPGE